MQPHPPRVPETLAELDLAVMLLGHVSKGAKMQPAKREKLKQLVGATPGAEQATVWKKVLKGLRPDMLELEAG